MIKYQKAGTGGDNNKVTGTRALGSASAMNATTSGTASTAAGNMVESADVGARAPGHIQQGVHAQPVHRH
jgi:hypothetical protein